MHMTNALLSPSVGIAFDAISVGALAVSAVRAKKEDFSKNKIPLMAVAGALVFAGQMINFTIPGTGSSGHIGGGILLAGLLGSIPAFFTIALILITQCLFFADGGLLALGCNIFNMGVVPCLVVFPFIFKPILKKEISLPRLSLASIASVMIGLELGALGVVLQTYGSGITDLSFSTFATYMLPIHLAIGLIEGIVTATVLCLVHQLQPEITNGARLRKPVNSGASMKNVLVILAALAMIAGGVLSTLASSYPDGLEWSIEKTAGLNNFGFAGILHESAKAAQNSLSFLPNYNLSEAGSFGTSVAGIAGVLITFLLVGAAGFAISKAKRKEPLRKGSA